MSLREQMIREGEKVLESMRQVLGHIDEQLRILYEQREALWKKYGEAEENHRTMLAKLKDD